jgi:hypothetical protein
VPRRFDSSRLRPFDPESVAAGLCARSEALAAACRPGSGPATPTAQRRAGRCASRCRSPATSAHTGRFDRIRSSTLPEKLAVTTTALSPAPSPTSAHPPAFRQERDFLGAKDIPAGAYWGLSSKAVPAPRPT